MPIMMGPPEGKCLDIETVSQNRLNAIKQLWNYENSKKNCSMVLGVTPRGLPPKIKF